MAGWNAGLSECTDCLMARILSLLPGNRTEPVSLDLILRKFLTPPALDNVHHGLPAATALEARAFSKGGSRALPPVQGLKIETDQQSTAP